MWFAPFQSSHYQFYTTATTSLTHAVNLIVTRGGQLRQKTLVIYFALSADFTDYQCYSEE